MGFEKHTILIVDDLASVRRGLRALLGTEGRLLLVGEAADGETALVMASGLKPDVILLDLLMPGLNGRETATAIFDLHPECKIIFLSHYLEWLARIPLTENVFGLWVKDDRLALLPGIILEVAAGQKVRHPALEPASSKSEFPRSISP